LLSKYLELPNGIPGYDTMRRVMGVVSPQYLDSFLQQWNILLEQNQTSKLRKILSIDGKTQRGNATSKQKPNHIVSAVDENKLCWGQERVGEKTNEITAIPRLLERLNIEISQNNGKSARRHRKARILANGRCFLADTKK